MTPGFISTLANKLRGIFGNIPSGMEPFELDTGTEVVGGLTLPVTRVYPLRALPDGRQPIITSRHFLNNKERKNHNGVDFFYRWKAGDAAMKIGDGGRTKNWVNPIGTLAVAAADGIVTLAGPSATGHRVWVQHAGGLYTGYFHLTRLVRWVEAGTAIKAGEPIGYVGDNPKDNDARHLHFEVYQGDLGKYPRGTVDPERFLKGATVLKSV